MVHLGIARVGKLYGMAVNITVERLAPVGPRLETLRSLCCFAK